MQTHITQGAPYHDKSYKPTNFQQNRQYSNFDKSQASTWLVTMSTNVSGIGYHRTVHTGVHSIGQHPKVGQSETFIMLPW